MSSTVTVTCEQAVYGSFPFRNQGYDILTASTGCRPEWLDAFARYCRDLGQPPSDASPVVDRLLFARKIPAGPWVVALGSAQGCDDRGRPGAWAFHGLFLSNRDYRSLGASPFPLRPHLIDRFSAGMSLTGGPIQVDLPPDTGVPEIDPSKIRWIAKGRKLRCEGSFDTFESTERFWRSLGIRMRSRRSLTTWSFRSATPFHWSCVGIQRVEEEPDSGDRSVLKFLPEELENPVTSHHASFRERSIRILMGLGATVLAILFLWSFASHDSETSSPISEPADRLRFETAAPSIASFEANEMPMDVQNYLRERLADWAERLGTEPDRSGTDVAMEAARIARAIRYTGPLHAGEMQDDGDPSRRLDIARTYVEVIRRQSRCRPWPEAGESANPAYALATLAWCVRSESLANEASQLHTIADARRWFDRFLEEVISPGIPSELPTTGLEGLHPELIEYRLHLSRIARLK